MPSSRGSSRPRDQTQVTCIAGGFFTTEEPSRPDLGGFVCLINFAAELEFYLGPWHLSPRVLIGMGRLISCTLTPFSCFLPPCVNCVGICLSCQITGSFEARDRTLGMFVFPTAPATLQAGINKGLLNK